jgi:Holliday junction resolvasome RuvABC endonuclease subunit
MSGERRTNRAIGIRASPQKVWYGVVEGEEEQHIVAVDSIVVPPALHLPEQLHFVRTTLLDILLEYGIRRAGIRLTEPAAQSTSIERLNLEGVIQELLSSSDVEAYFAGAIATIAARLGEGDRARVKEYFDGGDFRGLKRWSTYSREERESIVTAVAAARLPDRYVRSLNSVAVSL